MTATRDQWRLFGLDLRALWHAFRSDWSDVLRGRPFTWLTRVEPVRLLTLAGPESVRHGCSATESGEIPRPDALAIELPDDLVLERTIAVPDLPRADIERIVEFDVSTNTPFAEADLVWGWQRGAPEAPVRVALAARPHVERFLAAQAERLAGLTPEVWFDSAQPILLRGFGETRRQARARRRLALNLGLVAALAAGLAALVLTPVLLARNQTFEAQAKFAALQQRATDAVKLRDSIGASNALLSAIAAQLTNKPDAATLLDALTKVLADDVVLDRFELRGDLVRISGRANEAAKLLESLSAQSQFRAVHAPAAIARNAAGGKETFVIEFNASTPARPAPPASGPSAAQDATPNKDAASPKDTTPAKDTAAATPAAATPAAAPPAATPAPVTPTPAPAGAKPAAASNAAPAQNAGRAPAATTGSGAASSSSAPSSTKGQP